ncbi:hypothetical protein GF357_02280 [Candidatus Dojkabacteria bacterium]|nr:hypothetical protein [Candidatus Dojkabacteria bacterium]
MQNQKMKGKKRNYSGQILPIIMIILVVGIVLALALYSRNIKNRMRLIGEKRSTEASQEVESIIRMIESTDRDELMSIVLPELQSVDEYCMDGDEIESELGVSVDLEVLNLNEGAESEVELCFTKDNEFPDGITIPEYESYSIMIDAANSGCTYDFVFDGGGLVVHKIYAIKDVDGNPIEIKPYSTSGFGSNHTNDDIFGICPGCLSGGTYSPFGSNYGWDTNGAWSFTLDAVSYGGKNYEPHEIRIIAAPGPVTMQMTSSVSCNNAVAIRVTPKATNVSSFQGSYFSIPVSDNALSIFDYVLYNSSGDLKYVGDE